METATNYGSWPRQRPRRRGDRSQRERLDDVFIPGLQQSQFATEENKTASLSVLFLLLHQARKFKDALWVGGYLKETPFDPPPPAVRHLPHPDHKGGSL
ncbi:hypothetical protein Leryth_024566 [Lithospermum erythrorhizon]|nr:hypothetical protein Leryth_024566 [Lithospermum erythrorhizon]